MTKRATGSSWIGERGAFPQIETYLDDFADSERSVLLDELLKLELELRREQGDRPQRREYQQRFPEYSEIIAIVFDPEASMARVADPAFYETLAQVSAARQEQDDRPCRPFPEPSMGRLTSAGTRFRILHHHARGGFGEVFVALDTELNREVGLKQILESHADDQASRRRFLLEAEITGRLEHPGIVPVYGLGTYADGRPYYAMRFIKGDSLKKAIDRYHASAVATQGPGPRSLELRKLLRRFIDICNAIDYAHSRGVLHRDIKPGNVIVGKYGETLVVDWGLAKATGQADPESDERTLLPSSAGGDFETMPGSAFGTPAYMSPEQAEGRLDAVGPRSDVYSLGATLYCLLTGRPPFPGESADAIARVRRGDFQPPRSIDQTLDPALEAVCEKAMALKPEDRYLSCRALAEDIERWMADEPVTAWREPFIGVRGGGRDGIAPRWRPPWRCWRPA